MAEQIDLTTPTSNYKVKELQLAWPDLIKVVLEADNQERKVFMYSGPEANTLLISLNKADLSTNSLHRRILNKLIADGKIAGTVSGTVD